MDSSYAHNVSDARSCCRPGCNQTAIATLTYVYEDSTVVLGQLSLQPDPHTWDLCLLHATRFSAPKGWELLRSELPMTIVSSAVRDEDDLTALAEAVREQEVHAHPARTAGSSHACDTSSMPTIPMSAVSTSRSMPQKSSLLPPASNAIAKKTGRRGHLRLLPDPK